MAVRPNAAYSIYESISHASFEQILRCLQSALTVSL